jgi:hypothetical protein
VSERKPHKHAEVIKAWADGHVIQVKVNGVWVDVATEDPAFYPQHEFRVKPEPKKLYIQTIRYANNDLNIDVSNRSKSNLNAHVNVLVTNYRAIRIGGIIEVELHPDA